MIFSVEIEESSPSFIAVDVGSFAFLSAWVLS